MRSITKTMAGLMAAVIMTVLSCATARATDFRPAENALGEYRSIRYENIYTKVPTTGKLVSIKITDEGKIYYICKEKNGFAIYNLEIRPMEKYREKIEQELKDKSKNWDSANPDDLLMAKDKGDKDIKRYVTKYCDAVWVRNEIVIEERQDPRQAK